MKFKFTFFNSLVFIPVMLFIAFLFSITLVLAHPLYSKQTIKLLVNEENTTVSMDTLKSGRSQLTKVADASTSGFQCIIEDKQLESSCRLEISLTDDRTKGLDLSKFSHAKIYGHFNSPTTNDFLRISFRNFEQAITIDNHEEKFKYNLVELKPSELTKPIHVDFKRLIVPNWWLSKVRDQEVKSEVDLRNISYIEVATGLHSTPGQYLLNVSVIELHREVITKEKLYEYLLISWTVIVILLFITLSVYLQFKIRKKLSNKRVLEEINESLSIRSEKLSLINITDELTSVLNRNGMENKLKECLNNKWFPITAVMVDIDYFKKINDVFGHLKGDEVLIELGGILNNFTQNNESVSRFGGEEFLIIMPQQNKNQTIDRLEKLRKTIAAFDMKLGYHLTVSMGASTCHNIKQFNKVMEQADKALYEAKNNGRNCVKFYK